MEEEMLQLRKEGEIFYLRINGSESFIWTGGGKYLMKHGGGGGIDLYLIFPPGTLETSL